MNSLRRTKNGLKGVAWVGVIWGVLLAFIMPLAYALEGPVVVQDWWLIAGKDAYVLTEPGPVYRAKFEVGENVSLLVTNEDKTLAAVASLGAIKPNFTWGGITELWPTAGSTSSITVIKRPSLELVGRYSVPFRPGFVAFTPDSKALVVVSLGQVSKNNEKHIPPQVFLLDISSGKILHASQLTSAPADFWYVPSKNRLLVACEGFTKRAGANPELVVYDTETGAVERTKLPSPALKWRETGVDDLRYLETGNGVLVVNSEGKQQGDPILAGAEKLFLLRAPRGDRYFLAGKSKKEGKLLVIEKGQVLKSLDVPPLDDLLFDAGESRLILCAPKQGLILDPQSFNELAKIPLPGSFLEVMFAPGEKRLYVNQIGDRVSVIDLEKKQEIAHFTSGREGIKFLQAAAAGLATGLSPYRYGMTVRMPREEYHVPTAVQTMAIAPSGKFVFVFNSQTNDITVVETLNHTTLKKIPTGAVVGNQFLWQLPGGRHLISVGLGKLLTFDMETGEMITEQQFSKSSLRYEPSLGLLFVQNASGLEIHRTVPFEKIRSIESPGKLLFVPEAQRFFHFSAQGPKLYDYGLNLLKDLEGIPEASQVYFVSEKKVQREVVSNLW